MLTLSTPYQIEKTEILKNFDDLSQLRTTTKRTEEGKNVFTTKVLVPKNAVIRKEEGATAAASHLPSPSAGRTVFWAERANREIQTIGKYS